MLDDFYNDEYDLYFDSYEDDDRYECMFPGQCMAPGFIHHQDECCTADMMEEQYRYYGEMNRIETSKFWKIIYGIRDWFKVKLQKESLPEIPDNWDDDSFPF